MGTSVFDKVKTIAAGVWGGPINHPQPLGSPGRCFGEGVGAKPPYNFVFFRIKHAKIVTVKVNIG